MVILGLFTAWNKRVRGTGWVFTYSSTKQQVYKNGSAFSSIAVIHLKFLLTFVTEAPRTWCHLLKATSLLWQNNWSLVERKNVQLTVRTLPLVRKKNHKDLWIQCMPKIVIKISLRNILVLSFLNTSFLSVDPSIIISSMLLWSLHF